MNTSIGYRGKVTIRGSKGKPSKGSKNAGTLNLFTALANVVAKKYDFDTIRASMPTYFDFKQGEESILNSKIIITTSNVSTKDSEVTVTLRGLVTYAKMRGGALTGITARLLSADGETVLASSELDDSAVSPLVDIQQDVNGQATVEWEMIIGNFTSAEPQPTEE